MRTRAKVVGMGARKSGIGKKTGRPYDFTTLHLVYPDKNTEGFAVAPADVDQSILDPIPLPKINDEIDIVYHLENFKMVVDAII